MERDSPYRQTETSQFDSIKTDESFKSVKQKKYFLKHKTDQKQLIQEYLTNQ